MLKLTVIIPTFCRPSELRRATLSVLAQQNAPPFELLLVDNDPSASASDVSQELSSIAPDHIPIRYIHEPNAGVANARNTAIANARTDLIAFLDDDQSVPDHWLSALIAFHDQFPAAATFGPVITRLPDTTRHHREYLEAFFARAPQLQSGWINHFYGCGNCLLDLSLINRDGDLFDTAMNETGGEDDLLFQSILKDGQKFGWCEQAPAFEHVPEARADLSYTLKRAFAYGQGPITLARTAKPRQLSKIAFWMLVGLFKAVTNYSMYVVSWLTRSPSRAFYLDRAARGVGKMFWWVSCKFYGAGALAQKAAN